MAPMCVRHRMLLDRWLCERQGRLAHRVSVYAAEYAFPIE